MSKKKVALLCTLLLILGVLLGVGSSYTFSHLSEIKSAADSYVGKDQAGDATEETTEEAVPSEERETSEETETAVNEETTESPLQTPEDALTTASSK